ncbi:MAG TPA: SMP-30/gluconolactonase/LRE family protein [Methylomirabilota bacterium]|nr:SMP-30/gluconolactonase/LRE family protein [Methylomirabilota bacterium]
MKRPGLGPSEFGRRAIALVAWLGLVLATALGGAGGFGLAQMITSAPSAPGIVRLDPRLDRLVPSGATLERIVEGLSWTEGPVWDRRRGDLLFSDVPGNAVHRWRPDQGLSLFLRPSGYTGAAPFPGKEPGANGLAFDAAGRLVLCEHGDRRIARLEPDGRKTPLADRYQGRRLNSPNDLVFHSNGDLYFTDPPFGLPDTFDDPAKELPFSGVFRMSASGELTLLTRELRAPNGIALSPSESTLYVSNAERARAVWMAYPMRQDGTLGPGRVFFDATGLAATRPGGPDGMKVDREGNLFAAGPGGVYVLGPDGTHLGSIEIGSATGNVAWGEDGRVLYITAGSAVYRVRLTTRGVGF